jgi:hypothetical protein
MPRHIAGGGGTGTSKRALDRFIDGQLLEVKEGRKESRVGASRGKEVVNRLRNVYVKCSTGCCAITRRAEVSDL